MLGEFVEDTYALTCPLNMVQARARDTVTLRITGLIRGGY